MTIPKIVRENYGILFYPKEYKNDFVLVEFVKKNGLGNSPTLLEKPSREEYERATKKLGLDKNICAYLDYVAEKLDGRARYVSREILEIPAIIGSRLRIEGVVWNGLIPGPHIAGVRGFFEYVETANPEHVQEVRKLIEETGLVRIAS